MAPAVKNHEACVSQTAFLGTDAAESNPSNNVLIDSVYYLLLVVFVDKGVVVG